MNLQAVAPGLRLPLLPLLLIADESEEIVQTYIDEGTMYKIAMDDGEVVGWCK